MNTGPTAVLRTVCGKQSLFYLENSLPNEGIGDGIEKEEFSTPEGVGVGAPSYTLHHWELRAQFGNSFIFTNVLRVLRQGRKSYDRYSLPLWGQHQGEGRER